MQNTKTLEQHLEQVEDKSILEFINFLINHMIKTGLNNFEASRVCIAWCEGAKEKRAYDFREALEAHIKTSRA